MKQSDSKQRGGRPATMKDGRQRSIYIDDESWRIAQLLGDGRASDGIRRALNECKDKKQ